MSVTIKERMKRMDGFQADKKQKQIRQTLTGPDIEFSSLREIDQKFTDMCEQQNTQIFATDRRPQAAVAASIAEEMSIQQRAKQTVNSTPQIHSSSSLRRNKSNNAINRIFSSRAPEQKPSDANKNQAKPMLRVGQQSALNVGLISSGGLSNLQTATSLNSISHKRAAGTSHRQLNVSHQQGTETSHQSLKKLRSTLSPENRRIPSGIELHKLTNSKVRFGPSKPVEQKSRSILEFKDDGETIDIEERVSQSVEWQLIQKRLQAQLKVKKPNEKSDEFMNPLVKLFGNNFIAMVMQALIVKKIDDVYGVKIHTDSNVPISENLLRQFGIQTTVLNQLNTAADRNSYIADTMSLRITMMIKEWDEKHQHRSNRLEEALKEEEKEEQRKTNTHADMFEWLKVGTNHEMLKKKLRMSIIEKLTDFENQSEIANKVRANNTRNMKSPQNASQRLHQQFIELKSIPAISAKVLLLRMNEDENKHLKSELTPEQLQQFEDFKRTDLTGEDAVADFGDREEASLPDWSEDLEREFLNNKKLARFLYSSDIATSSWNKQGYLPLVQEYNLTNKKKMERESLIQKYQNGCWLTEKELKFISDTSSLLNKCIDKQHVQSIVQVIRPDDISQLELNLAETIISNYENMQKLIREQRSLFLEEKQRNTLKARRRAQNKELLQHEREKELRKHRRTVKMFKTIGSRLLTAKATFIFETFRKNFFCRLFFEKMRESLIRIRKKLWQQQLQQFEVDDAKEKLKKQLDNQKEFIAKMAKGKGSNGPSAYVKSHELHPPSKLQFFPEQEAELINPTRLENIKQMVDKFQLTTNSKQSVRVKDNFAKFYSGGPRPSTIEARKKLDFSNLVFTKQQLKGIILIQTVFRQMRMRKLIRQMKELDFQQKRLLYEDKLWSYRSGGRFLKYASKMAGKDLVRKITIKTQVPIGDSEGSDSFYSSSDEERNYKVNGVYQTLAEARLKRKQKKQQQSQQDQLDRDQSQSFLTPSKSEIVISSQQKIAAKLHGANNSHSNSRVHTHFSTENHHTSLNSQVMPFSSVQNTSKLESNKLYESIFSQYSIENNNNNHNNNTKDKNQTLPSQVVVTVDGQSSHVHFNDEEDPLNKLQAYQQPIEQDGGANAAIPDNESIIPTQQSISQSPEPKLSYQKKQDAKNEHVRQLVRKLTMKYTPNLLLKQQKLLAAAKQNRFIQIKNAGYLLHENDVNVVDKEGNSALYYATSFSNVPFVRWLLSRKADINQICAGGNTPTHQAFKQNDEEILHDFLCLTPNLNIVNHEEMTPLAYAPHETLHKLNLQHVIVTRPATNVRGNTPTDNNLFLTNTRQPIKAIGKVKLDNFYPFKHPTIFKENYTSL